jgi:hypothetical protein
VKSDNQWNRTDYTDYAGGHRHSLNINGSGTHNHPMKKNGSGSHNHPLNINGNGSHNPSFTTNNTGGNETRPTNVALMYCIKT